MTKQSPDPGNEINLKTANASKIQEISNDSMTEKEINSVKYDIT